MPFSEQTDPLEGKPPAYAEIFAIASDAAGRTEDSSLPVRSGAESAEPAPPKTELLSFPRLDKGDAILTAALGLRSRAEIPQLFFGEESAKKVASHIEKNSGKYKELLKSEARQDHTRKAILADIDHMLRQAPEYRRMILFVRWFRDKAAPADLNPFKLIDPDEPAKGNLLQLVHPVLFNFILLFFCIFGVILGFGYWYHQHGGK